MAKTLEQRYNDAPDNSYVGRVRTQQAADRGAAAGVNFMDAGARNDTTDNFQSNFQRRASDDKTIVQGGTETSSYEQNERKGLSRWFGRALNYAFTNPRTPNNSIQDSTWTTHKSLRPETRDSWADNPTSFHRWTPSAKFNAATTLSPLARNRATGKTAPTSE